MLTSSARASTERPSTYLKQLCEHFADETQRHSAQQFEVTHNDREGFINFAPVASGTCRLDGTQEGVLLIEAGGTDEAALERVQRIVTKHLERFGQHDGLRVEWGPASESSKR